VVTCLSLLDAIVRLATRLTHLLCGLALRLGLALGGRLGSLSLRTYDDVHQLSLGHAHELRFARGYAHLRGLRNASLRSGLLGRHEVELYASLLAERGQLALGLGIRLCLCSLKSVLRLVSSFALGLRELAPCLWAVCGGVCLL